MSLVSVVLHLSVAVAFVRGQNQFSDTVPEDYYLRKDLSDCSERFHKHKYYTPECLVFGGAEAKVTEFPHMAVLGWTDAAGGASNGSVQWQCGGTLITERFVLTAAHCAANGDDIPPRLVRLGDVNLASSEDDEFAQQFGIRRIERHPQHRFAKRYFDLALIELDGAVRLTHGVCPACLWSNERRLPSAFFEAVGFGEIALGAGPVPNLLKTIAAHISWIESVVNETMDHARCTEKYAAFRLWTSLVPECRYSDVHTSRVNLLWPEGAKRSKIPCSGTFIDYNTVVTSASCTRNEDGLQPIEIDLGWSWRYNDSKAKIVEIQVHPDYRETSHENDLALLRLDKYLNAGGDTAPSCIPLPRSTEICSDRHTHDRSVCWDKFTERIKTKLLDPKCNRRGTEFEASTVNLLWADQDTSKPACRGMIIKPDTVITSLRCMALHGANPPVEVELNELGTRVKIVQIFRHAGYRAGNRNHDTALLILAEEQHKSVPKCVYDYGNELTKHTQVPVYGRYDNGPTDGHLYLRVRGLCNESMQATFKELHGEKVASGARYTCWDSDRHLVPGEVPLSPGAAFLDVSRRFIRGLVNGATSFGSVDPIVSINLTTYADWITRFVLYRPPKLGLVFRGGPDEFEQGSTCTLKNGTAGNCMPDYGCEREIRQHKSSDEIVICGFEGSISYICCPVGHQDIPVIGEIEVPSAVRLLPPLPYENVEV
uniref:Peptidase S1 domain-containing protein n=1 Tax=Anopheles dirus TaxID=7168 RepID=A0A182NU55_9DIPT